jgi:hypothetical protein
VKEAVLEFRTSTHWLITDRSEGYLTLHVGEWEEVTFIGWYDNLVETSGGLWTKLVAHIDELRWRTLPGHVGSSSVEHSIWTTAVVKGTGLRIDEDFLSGLHRWKSARILNYCKTRL